MRLKSYASGPYGKMFIIEAISPTYQLSAYVCPPVTAILTGTISPAIGQLTSTTTLISANSLNRAYEPNQDNIIMQPPQSTQIYDLTQIGDFAFSVTKESFETVGTRLKLSPDSNQDSARFNTSIWPNIHSNSFILSAPITPQTSPSVAHEIANYYAEEDIDARMIALTARLQLNWIHQNGVASMPDTVFAGLSAQYVSEAESLKEELLFDIEKRIYDASIDYYQSPRLICATNGGAPYAFLLNGNYMGYSQGIPANYALEVDLGYTMLSGSLSTLLVNPMKLKNIYDNSFETELDSDDAVLKGFRSYVNIGTMQDSVWLAYKYVRDIDEGTESANVTRDYAFVERVKGLYSMSAAENHKSNIYSIRIKDSGLNGDILQTKSNVKLNVYDHVAPTPGTVIGTISADDAKIKLRALVEAEVKNILAKTTPAETQLWQILWEGR